MKKDILTLLDLSKEDFELLFKRAFELKEQLKEGAAERTLAGKTLGLIFDKPSTRTRISFEAAIIQLGGTPIFINARDTQIGRNEPVRDTARVLSRYLDGLAIRTYSQDLLQVTLEHLLEHTTGRWTKGDPIFHGTQFSPDGKYELNSADNPQNWSHTKFMKFVVEELCKSPNDATKLFDKTPTGYEFKYTNINFYILGRIIEKATGLSYETYVRRHILAPIGITHMYIGGKDWRDLRKIEPDYETNYEHNEVFHRSMKRFDAHGGWIANSTDIVRFATSVRGTILNDYYWNLLFDRGTTTVLGNSPGFYKRGWLRHYDGTVQGSGNMSGTSANLMVQNDLAIAVLVNGSKESYSIIIDLLTNISWRNDVPLTGDIDGDGKKEMIIFRPGYPVATWWVKEKNGSSYNKLLTNFKYGYWRDTPLVANVNNAGGDELVLCRPELGLLYWYAIERNGSTWHWTGAQWGLDGDIPMIGNLDNDSRAEMILWRPSNGKWYAKEAVGGQIVVNNFRYGKPWDLPLVGDVDENSNNGDEMIIWKRWGGGLWYARNKNSSRNTWNGIQWGLAGDVPLVGDLNNNGAAEMTVWRPSSGKWYSKEKNAGTPLHNGVTYGSDPIDVPMIGNSDGAFGDDIIIWKPSTGKWYSRTGVILRTYWNGHAWGIPWN